MSGRKCRGAVGVFMLSAVVLLWVAGGAVEAAEHVERWGIFEMSLRGPSGGNPFTDVRLSAKFEQGGRFFEPEGFYDGGGVYKVRFMPDRVGTWQYVTRSDRAQLDGKTGTFVCVKPSAGNHGPVGVHNKWYFAYADGTSYFQVGTTCYAWPHQGDELEEQTLRTLRDAPFNKMRMCVFPKSYSYNKNEPEYYPYQGRPLKDWDFARFNPAFWRHFEKRVADLRDLGVEADLILFHPYDRWGFADMGAEADDGYLRYAVARLAAYRNVWWSFANEYDLMKSKKMADWDRFFQVVQKYDPYQRLRGIHNCRGFYDHNKPWVTHCSIQSSALSSGMEWRRQYNKPVVFDECKYEGNIPQGWGNITAKELTRRFWLGTIQGCYVGHGETYKHPQDILWWSKGGVLHGDSPARIAFLKQIMEPVPFAQMTPAEVGDGNYVLSEPGELYFVYFTRPADVNLELTGARAYKVDGIDTWAMRVASLGSAGPGRFVVTAPQVPYLVRLTAYRPDEPMRPAVKASAEPSEAVAPLKVRFSTDSRLGCLWDFGDGATSSKDNPAHTYEWPGLYAATVTVTDEHGLSTTVPISIAADRATNVPIVRVGFAQGETPRAKLHGKIVQGRDGTFDLGDGEPWRWISVGDGPIEDLEGLRSFTVLGWAKPSSLKIGSGGNRIAFNLKYNRSGFDLVHLQDGRLRLAVNEWPDGVRNDSSQGELAIGKWTFFAVTYDTTRANKNVRWYFGDQSNKAALDRTTDYNRGATGKGSGPLTVGNYNETIHNHGKDRQFRGQLRGIAIFGSRIGSRGALSLEAIQAHQQEGRPGE